MISNPNKRRPKRPIDNPIKYVSGITNLVYKKTDMDIDTLSMVYR